MGTNSSIEWTDDTWNPLAGCTWASPGCDLCYAAIMARRLDFMAQADIVAGRNPGHKRKYMGITNKNKAGHIMFNGKVNLDEGVLSAPLTWRKPRRVFVNSMSDLFHKEVPDAFIGKVWSAMLAAPQHTFQVLTKRPERMAEVVTRLVHEGQEKGLRSPDNIWLGTSVENQEQADRRIPELMEVPAKVRFLSCEPLLGPVDLDRHLWGGICETHSPWICHCSLKQWKVGEQYCIHWVIAGGESGNGARPAHPDWFRGLRDQCQEAGVAYFFKQHGNWMPLASADEASHYPHAPMREGDNIRWVNVGKHAAGRLLDGREWNELPV